MARRPTSRESHRDDHEVEKHLRTVTMIEAALAKQFPTDFPEEYFRENINMDRLFMIWHFKFEKKLTDILEADLQKYGKKSVVCRYDATDSEEEHQLILDEIKKVLYTDL
jgi:hypothetical protein